MPSTNSPNRPAITRRSLIHGIAAIGGAGAAYTAMHAMGLFGNGQALAASVPRYSTTEALPNGSMDGKRVIVIGGGDTAMDCVRTAIRQGAT